MQIPGIGFGDGNSLDLGSGPVSGQFDFTSSGMFGDLVGPSSGQTSQTLIFALLIAVLVGLILWLN